MVVQDDRREDEQRELFGLREPKYPSRIGPDAILDIDGMEVEFELKSTTKESVSTVRDFGMEHIRKWQGKHWLFGFYTANGKGLRFTRYASPRMMETWVDKMHQYVWPDYVLAELVPQLVGYDAVKAMLGDKDWYTLEDAKAIQKKQYSKHRYHEMMDISDGYSPARMLQIVQDRCQYLLRRGSTLNNPHIPPDIFANFPKITQDHSSQLRELVHQELQRTNAS